MICCICTRLWFTEKVEQFRQSTYSEQFITRKCVEYFKKKFISPKFEMLYVCHTCDSYLLKGKTPPQATVNNMQICDSDSVFNTWNTLEQQLISMFIPFEKSCHTPTIQAKWNARACCLCAIRYKPYNKSVACACW